MHPAERGEGMSGAAVIAKGITEKQLSDNIVSLARMLGWLVHRDPTWRATGADPGYPDLTLVRERQVIFAELKSEKGSLTDDQWAWVNALVGIAVDTHPVVRMCVWRPSQWLDGTIEAVLR